MNRQRNSSFKLPTRSLVFYFSISSSIIFLTSILIWLNKTTTTSNSVPLPPIETAAGCLQYFNSTSSSQVLGFRPPLHPNLTANDVNTNISELNGPPNDSLLKLKGTLSSQPENASCFSGTHSLVREVQTKENESQVGVAQHGLHHDEEGRSGAGGELDRNFAAVEAQSAPPRLFDKIENRTEEQNPLNKTEEQNASSGFSGNINSLISGLQRKEDESQVAQDDLHHDEEDGEDEELDGDFIAVEAQSAPAAIFIDKITEEQNAASSFSGINPLTSGLQRKENESQVPQHDVHNDEEDRGGEFDGNFTTVAQSPPPIVFEKIETRTEEQQNAPWNKTEEQNDASGVSENINSLIWTQRKENESQVAQPALHDHDQEEEDRARGESDAGNLKEGAQSSTAPAILIQKVEIRTEEQNAPPLNKKNEEQNAALRKRIEAKSRKRRGKKKKKKNNSATSFDELTQISSGGPPVEEDTRSMINLGGCDFSTRGRWVYDESYPLYTKLSCPFIERSFDCPGNGRLDNNFMKWRWQPEDCDIPRFDATKMLERMRGKRLVFVGDSLNRNQMQSMVCMLMGARRGLRVTRVMNQFTYIFLDYKFRVEFYTSPFLVHKGMASAGRKQVQTLQIDSIDQASSRWSGADILVFDTGHWWNDHKTNAGINFYQEGGKVHPYLDVSTALRKALMTWASWVDKYTNPRKTRVFFRSLSPTHYSGGQWNTGGSCTEATQPLLQPSRIAEQTNIIAEEVIKQMKTRVTLLNITSLSEYRIDGHPSKYGANHHPLGVQDCSHWCLPGIPDVWNQLLYLHLMSV